MLALGLEELGREVDRSLSIIGRGLRTGWGGGDCGNGKAEGSASVSVSVSSPAGLEMLAGFPDSL
jgi:hypothetical protein